MPAREYPFRRFPDFTMAVMVHDALRRRRVRRSRFPGGSSGVFAAGYGVSRIDGSGVRVAGTAVHGIVRRTVHGIHVVVATAAEHLVRPGAAEYIVVAFSARQAVYPPAAPHAVAAGPAGDSVVANLPGEAVYSTAAVEIIAAVAAEEAVGFPIAVQQVVTVASLQQVCPRSAAHPVVARAAADAVGAAPAEYHVLAGRSLHPIFSTQTLHAVITAEAGQYLRARSAGEPVFPSAAVDGFRGGPAERERSRCSNQRHTNCREQDDGSRHDLLAHSKPENGPAPAGCKSAFRPSGESLSHPVRLPDDGKLPSDTPASGTRRDDSLRISRVRRTCVAPESPLDLLSTPLCDLLGVRYPIIQAPMAGGWTTPELVAAVCNAGGLGVLAGARVPPERLQEDIRAVKRLTDRPFGVNFLLAAPGEGNPDVESVQRFLDRFRERLSLPPGGDSPALPPSSLPEQLEVVFEERVSVLSVALGDPGDLVERAHSEGMLLKATATTVEEAVLVAERGSDVIVAQGAEAGGHRSNFEIGPGGGVPLVGTMALVPQVVDAVDTPVVAAGGIADGRGLVAALALGAVGAQVGTRFLTARESGAHPAYRKQLMDADETDTVVTHVFTGRPARGLRNRLVEEYLRDGPEPLGWPLHGVAAGDIHAASRAAKKDEYSPLFAGQGLRMLKERQGAAEIVAELVDEAKAAATRLGGGL